jgi:uncharacterized protein (TIGR03067 family)
MCLLAGVLLVAPWLGSDSLKEYCDAMERDELQGTWQIITISVAGRQTKPSGEHCFQTFQGGKWSYSEDGTLLTGGIYKTDNGRMPGFLDETRTEPSPRTTKNIYRIEGGMLRTAFRDANEGECPTGFREEGIHIITWKRVP